MVEWAIGLSTGCFYHEKILDHLEAIRAAGFAGIEVGSHPDHLNYRDRAEVGKVFRRLRELEMEALSFHAPFEDGLDISNPDKEERQGSLEKMLQAVEAAKDLGARYFVVHPGPEEEHHGTAEELDRRREAARESLRQIAQRCTDLRVGFLLENKLPHLIFGSAEELLGFTATLDAGNLGICLDTGHAHLSGDLYGMVPRFSQLTRMIHAHDNFGEHDDHLPPGEGRIDWPRLLTLLCESRFAGAVILELELRHQDDPQRLLERAARSRERTRDLLRRLGEERLPEAAARAPFLGGGA